MSFGRKLRRKKTNSIVKNLAKQIKKSTSLMMSADHCSICNKEFIKTKESVKEWHVELFSFPKTRAILYCPECTPDDVRQKTKEKEGTSEASVVEDSP